jgi:hypothetical protein
MLRLLSEAGFESIVARCMRENPRPEVADLT